MLWFFSAGSSRSGRGHIYEGTGGVDSAGDSDSDDNDSARQDKDSFAIFIFSKIFNKHLNYLHISLYELR